MNIFLKGVAYVIAAIPLLFLAQCMYNEVSQPRALRSLCDTAKFGSTLDKFLGGSTKSIYKVRTGGPKEKDDTEWFDREYLRIGEYLKKTKKIAEDYTVVFVKPGMGYYACIVLHKNGLVEGAWFVDRSS